jgi:chemotaxis protein CheD
MVHVAAEALDEEAAADRMKDRVSALLADLEAEGGLLDGAFADIVGGADILHIYPRGVRQEVISSRFETLTAFLKFRKIEITRRHVGGSAARRVEMRVPGRRLEVQSVTRTKRRQAKRPRRRAPVTLARPSARSRLSDIVVDMGCMAVVEGPANLVALLGSCVGIALYDPETKIGGLAHVMLPSFRRGGGEKSKYADTAVPALLESLLSKGGSPRRVVAKLAGGANVLRTTNGEPTYQIGRANIESATHALGEHGVELLWQDTGGTAPRKMLVDLDSFDVTIKLIGGSLGS